MAHETLTCAESIAPERLSALRDGALAPAAAQRLRAHIAECRACQARLADYDSLATALRQQRELEPDERIMNGVRSRLATRTSFRQWRAPQRVWAGIATLIPAAAIILLFVYVFSGLASRGHPATSQTPTAPTAVPTQQNGKQVIPTATPALVTLPPMTPSISVTAAWGALSPVATYQTPTVANMQFDLATLSPDATTLYGTQMSVSQPTPGAVFASRVNLIAYDLASHTYKLLGPHWNGSVGPWGGAVSASANDLVYGYNSAPGATCGVCNNTGWAYDLHSGARWQFDPGKGYSGILNQIDSGDYVAFQTPDMGLWVANLAQQQVTSPLSVSEQANADIRLVGFSWPYLIYEDTPSSQVNGAPAATTLRIENLQTQATTIVTTPLSALFGAQNSAANIDWASTDGVTLYLTTYTPVNGVDASGAAVNTAYGTLFRMRLSSPASQPEMLARWPQVRYGQAAVNGANDASGADRRLIILGGGYIWDIAEGKLARLTSPQASQTPGAYLSGNYLVLTQSISQGNQQAPIISGAIYDMRSLPVR